MFASKDIFQTASTGGYKISRSVRLRKSATAYLNRTFGTPTSLTTWTWSGWVKRGELGTSQYLFHTRNAGNTVSWETFFQTDNTLIVRNYDGASYNANYVTTQLFRDPSAWYHMVVTWDTTNATSTDRVRIYINGSRVTAFNTSTAPASSANSVWNTSTYVHGFGAANGATTFDGYLTETNFIDGQALTPSSFGETNAITGVWQPKKYAGTYGTNGFYLNFSDNSTAAALGTDFSGNSNTWTVNNISVTAGVTYDSMLDVPTPYADGGNGRGNYCTLNPLDFNSGTVSNGNLQWVTSAAAGNGCFGTFAFDIADSTNKYYWEMTLTSGGDVVFGIVPLTTLPSNTSRPGSYGYYVGGQKYSGTTPTAYGASFTNGDVIGVTVGAGIITFYKNGTSQGSAFTGLTGFFKPAIWEVSGTYQANFGQRPFSYTPPTGFVALNTQNLPAPTISNGASYMAATTYTGTLLSNAVSNAVNGVSFQPDLVWIKSRSAATDNELTDSVRGVTLSLTSNSTAAEATDLQGLTAFNSGGFTVGTNTTYNNLAATYVAWQWNAGGSTVTNTSGTISAQVRANPTAGFSVVTYTGTGVAATIGHGLGVAPSMVITKVRSTANDWGVYHSGINDPSKALLLDSTAAAASYGGATGMWNNTAPTSTVFSVGTNGSTGGSATYVAYCFAAVAGYSAFGSYTGNGSTDGPFVFLGFRPRFVITKSYDATAGVGDWTIHDTSRLAYNTNDLRIFANASSAESTSEAMDMLSNGFKIRATNSNCNTSGGGYIYMAFAENPFKLSLAR